MEIEKKSNGHVAVSGPSISVSRDNSSGNETQRSEQVQEIISRSHGGVLSRWALVIFLLILVILVGGAWFIRTPDVMEANTFLTAANAPKAVVTRQEGKLVKLFVNNEDVMKAGDMIGWIESTASHEEVIELSRLLDQSIGYLSRNETEKVSNSFAKTFLNLGELQSSYQQFIISWQKFNDYLVNGYYYKRKATLHEDYNYLKKVYTNMERQRELTRQDLTITEETFAAHDSLYQDNLIAKQELREQRSRLLSKQMTLPQIESSLLANENQQAAKKKEIDELEHDIAQQKNIFQQELQTLYSLVKEWKQKFIIDAPVDGRVVFIIPLQQDQYLQGGKTIGYVNPDNSTYYAQVILPQYNLGKVAVGQPVELRFDAYPYQEFGYVEGRLQYISRIPSDSGFLAKIELPQGLVTNYHKQIQYRNGLQSRAVIIIEKARLLTKLYRSIAKVND